MIPIDGSSSWRPRLLDTLLYGSTRLGLLVLVALIVPFRNEPTRWLENHWIALCASYATLVLLDRAKVLGYRTRARLFVTILLALGSLSLIDFGYTPTPVLVSALTVLSASLLLGPPAMAFTLFVTTLVFGVTGLSGQALQQGLSHSVIAGYTAGYVVITGSMAWLVEAALCGLEETAQKTEQALAHLRLEQEKRLRTQAELADTEQALFRAQKLEAVGRLAAGVGHDFNNALQVILSWTSLLQDDLHDPQIREGLQAIERAAAQGRELTSRLLTFGRREARSPVAIAPPSFVQELASSIKRLLPEDIELRLELSTTSSIWADPAQLDQVLLNLSLNARDAMPSGGTLVLGTRSVPRSQVPADALQGNAAPTWVDIWVRDTGTGMDPKTLSHIFEPFFTTKGQHGTGLGLSTAYSIIRQSQGIVTVESKLHHGSTFHVFLPESRLAPAGEPSPPQQPMTAKAVVLLAEDEPLVRSSLGRVLRKHGFEVIEAEDVPTGILRIAQARQTIHVLCTDGVMPGGEARSLIEAYLARWPDGQVLVCSGYVQEELLRRAIDAGDYKYLAKPFSPDVLVSRINTLVGIEPSLRPWGGIEAHRR